MTLYRIGGWGAHPHRNYWPGRPGATSVRLWYSGQPDNSDYGFDNLIQRIQQDVDRGVFVCVRMDWDHGQSGPPEGNNAACAEFAQRAVRLVTHPVGSRITWLVPGNENNHPNENRQQGNRPMSAAWVARYTYGYGRPQHETDNVYQFVRTFHPSVMVLLPSTAPYNQSIGGTRPMPNPNIHGRAAWSICEQWHYDKVYSAYKAVGHTPYWEVRFDEHTYGAPGIASIGPGEPFVSVPESTYGSQFGTRWIADAIWLAIEAMQDAIGWKDMPWTFISEVNMLRDNQTPAADYPTHPDPGQSWWPQVCRYLHGLPYPFYSANWFVDDVAYAISWANTALTSGIGRMPQVDLAHNWLMEHGW